MKADKENKLKTLLKQAGTDSPTSAFTDSVMQIIEADAAKETALKSILKQHPAEGPSFDFTASVMRQVSAQPKPVLIQPVITKKAWYAIAAVVMLMVLISVVAGTKANGVDTDNNRITTIIHELEAVPAIYALAALAVAILFVADYLINQRQKTAWN